MHRNVLIAGPRDVYLGLTGAVLGTIPTAAIYFTVYEWSKGQLEKRGWCAMMLCLHEFFRSS